MDLPLLTRRWQQRAVLALVGLSPLVLWRPIDDPFGLPKATLLVVVAIVVGTLGAIRAAAERRVLLPRHRIVWAALAFVGALAVTTAVSTNRAISVFGEQESHAGLIGYVACAAVALVVVRVFDESWAALLLGALVASATIVALYAILQRLEADPLTWGYSATGFVFSTMGNPNFAAGVLGVATPVAAGLALHEGLSSRWRLAAAGSGVVCLAGVAATTSFQGVAAAAAGLVVVAYAMFRTNRDALRARVGGRRIAVGALVGAAAIAVVALVTVDDLGSALDTGLDERMLIWRAAVDVISEKPIAGTGPDTFGQVFLAHRPAEHAIRYFYTRADQAHDVPLNMFATGGVILGVAYLALVALTGAALVRGLRTTTGPRATLLAAAGGGWLAYHVQSLVSLETPTLMLWHWVLTGLVFVLALDPMFAEYLLPGGVSSTAKPSRRQRARPPSTAVLGTIVVVGVLAAWFATRPLRSELAVERARDHANAGNAAAALADVRKATRLAGWTASAWLARTQIEEVTGDPIAAAGSAATAARRDEGSPELALVAARLFQGFRPREENPWWEIAVSRDPHNPTLLGDVARGLAVANPDRAGELAQRAVDLAPELASVWAVLGDVLAAAGDRDAAIEAYERSIAIDPNGPGAAGLEQLEQEASADG